MSGEFEAIAQDHWPIVPDWVRALARACDGSSQAQIGRQIGRSGALISQVLRNKYAGDLNAVEEVVRGHFMAALRNCPELGNLPLHECRGWQAKARNFAGTNALRVRMFRACQRCPHFKTGAQDDG